MLNTVKNTLLRLTKDKEKLVGFILFLLVISIYTYTSGKYHVSIADSDEYSTIGYTLGVAHAPGYPIYILIIYIFEHIIPIGSIAFRANLTSVLFNSLTITLVYFTSIWILKNIDIKGIVSKKKEKNNNDITNINSIITIAALSSLFLAFSFLFWFYSNVAEVFALNNLFVCILVFLTVKLTDICFKFETKNDDDYLDKERRIVKLIVVISVIAGLALSHLQTIIIVYPFILAYIIYILYRSKLLIVLYNFKYLVYYILAFIIAFFMPFLMMQIFNEMHNSVSWNLNSGLDGLLSYITRQNYNGTSSVGGAYIRNINLLNNFTSIFKYLNSLLNDFSLILILISLIGGVFLTIRSKKLGLYFSILAIITTIGLGMYITFPDVKSKKLYELGMQIAQIGTVQRQYIMGDVLLSLLIAPGIYCIYSFGSKIIKRINISIALIAGMSFIIIFEFISNYNYANLNNFYYLEKYTKEQLNSLAQNSVLICFSDITCFGDLYEQQVNKTRPDITIATYTYDIRQYYYDHLKDYRKLNQGSNKYNLADILSWNLYRGKKVYVDYTSNDYLDFLDLKGGAFYLKPNGYVAEVVYDYPQHLSDNQNYSTALDYSKFFHQKVGGESSKNYWFRIMDIFFALPLYNNADTYFEEGDKDLAIKNENLAYSILENYEGNTSHLNSQNTYLTKSSNYPSTIQSSDDINAMAKDLIKNKNYSDGIKYAFRSILRNPLNIDARLTLAEGYKDNNAFPLAELEYLNILNIDSNNRDAKTALNEILKMQGMQL